VKTKKMAISAMFIAVGVLAGNIIYIPVGASKCFPVQHTLNILAAVFLGPAYGVINAFCISLLRNFMGTGSLLAFPGSMVGAFLAGMIYKMTKNNWATAVAEVVGTGVLGGLLAVPIAILMMGQEAGALAFVPSFLLSSFGGSVIAMILLKSAHFVQAAKKSI
jgi:protein ThiW